MRWRLAVVAVTLLVAAGCSDSAVFDPPDSSTPTSSSTASSSTSAAAPNPPVTIPADQSLLTDLGAIPAVYEFTSITTAGGTEALRIVGRRVDGATELQVSSAGAQLDYVIAADGSTWLRADGDPGWVVDDPLKIGDPLHPLRNPIAVRWSGRDDESNTYDADYEATAFGLPSGPAITLRIITNSDGISYRYQADGAEVDATITATGNLTPIEAPPA